MGGDDPVADREAHPGATPCGLVVKNGSKARQATSGSMPGPLSATSSTASAPSAQARTASLRGDGRPISACWAFTTRFTTTWCSWSASPCTGANPGGRSVSTCTSALRSP